MADTPRMQSVFGARLSRRTFVKAGGALFVGIGLAGTPVVITPIAPHAEPAAPKIPRQRDPGAHRPERVNTPNRRSPEPE